MSCYTHEGVELLLAYYFHGGKRWQRKDAPDDDMPTAAGNPAHQGTEMAEAIDVKRAWLALIESGELLDPAALWGRYAEDLPIPAIAQSLGVSPQLCEWRIFRDVEHLTVAINQGRRPAREETRWL